MGENQFNKDGFYLQRVGSGQGNRIVNFQLRKSIIGKLNLKFLLRDYITNHKKTFQVETKAQISKSTQGLFLGNNAPLSFKMEECS